MSPAKRKVAVSGRGGGKKRGVRKAHGKVRPAARKTRGDVAACDMPVSMLAAAFDRPEGAGPLLSHVPGCGACTTSLTVLAASSGNLRALVAQAAAGTTAVERIIARGASLAQGRLADLLYELAKRYLVIAQDVDRRLHLEQRPRPLDVIGREMQRVSLRLEGRAAIELNGIALASPTETTAMPAADACLRILQRLEGSTERQRLGTAVLLICSARPREAEQVLRDLLSAGRAEGQSIHAYRNLQWALNRQERFADSVQVGREAIEQFPDDWQLTYNLAVACAWCGDRRQFRSAAKRLGRMGSSSTLGGGTRQGVLRFEAPRFAEVLGLSTKDVLRQFGVGHADNGTSNEAG